MKHQQAALLYGKLVKGASETMCRQRTTDNDNVNKRCVAVFQGDDFVAERDKDGALRIFQIGGDPASITVQDNAGVNQRNDAFWNKRRGR